MKLPAFQLDYSGKAAIGPRRRAAVAIAGAAALAALYAGYWAYTRIAREQIAQYMYWHRVSNECSSYRSPAEVVYREIQGRVQLGQVPPCWQPIISAARPRMPDPEAPAWLLRRIAALGETPAITYVCRPYDRIHTGETLADGNGWIIRGTKYWIAPLEEYVWVYEVNVSWWSVLEPAAQMRVYAADVDASDSSRFRARFETSNEKGFFCGRFIGSGELELTVVRNRKEDEPERSEKGVE
jgi:hypothetical protein